MGDQTHKQGMVKGFAEHWTAIEARKRHDAAIREQAKKKERERVLNGLSKNVSERISELKGWIKTYSDDQQTTGETGVTLDTFISVAKGQQNKVLEYAKKHPDKAFSREDLRHLFAPSTPPTSIVRAWGKA
jgi:hypothetical protein